MSSGGIPASKAFFDLLVTSMGIRPENAKEHGKQSAAAATSPSNDLIPFHVKHKKQVVSRSEATDSAYAALPRRIPIPLQLKHLAPGEGEEVEGVSEDPAVDPFLYSNIRWSAQAPILKRLYEMESIKEMRTTNAATLQRAQFVQELKARFGVHAGIAHRIKTSHASFSYATSSTGNVQPAPHYKHQVFDEAFLVEFFQQLELVNLGIGHLDRKMRRFVHLRELNLVGNELTVISNLPEGLEVLSLQSNRYVHLNWLRCTDVRIRNHQAANSFEPCTDTESRCAQTCII
jgi:hypothetical protein